MVVYSSGVYSSGGSFDATINQLSVFHPFKTGYKSYDQISEPGSAKPVFSLKAKGSVTGWEALGYNFENANNPDQGITLQALPGESFYSVNGKVVTAYLNKAVRQMAVNNVKKDIISAYVLSNPMNQVAAEYAQTKQVVTVTGADARLSNGQVVLGLLGTGTALALFPGEVSGVVGGKKSGSFSQSVYTLNTTGEGSHVGLLSTQNNIMVGGKPVTGQHLEYVLPGFMESPSPVYTGPVVDNNFIDGAKAYFGQTIAAQPARDLSGKYDASLGIDLFGMQNTFYGAGLKFGPNGSFTALSTDNRSDTYWGVASINITNKVAPSYGGLLDNFENGQLVLSGQENVDSGLFSLDKTWNASLQKANLSTYANGSSPIKALVSVTNLGRILAGMGQSYYFASELAPLPNYDKSKEWQ